MKNENTPILEGKRFDLSTVWNIAKWCPIRWVSFEYKDSSKSNVLRIFGIPVYSVTSFICPIQHDEEEKDRLFCNSTSSTKLNELAIGEKINFKQIEVKEKDCYLIHYKGQALSITPKNMEVFIEQGFTYESNLASLPDKFEFI